MKPSASAILIPAESLDDVAELVERAFRSRGFRPHTTPLPAGYPLRRDEWFDFGIGWGQSEGAGLVIPSDVESVFRVSVVLSATLGPSPLVAFRRFMGMEPVMKLFIGGKPRWRDGQDDDLESKYEVPTIRPEGIAAPETLGLPESAEAMEAHLGANLRRYEAARHDEKSGLQWMAFLSRKSALSQA